MSSKRGEDRRVDAAPEPPFRNPHGQRGASTPARIAAVAAVLIAFAVVIALLLGGDGGTRYTFLFQTGGQLVPGNEVLVAGQRVGSVDSIDLTDDNQAAVEVTMDEPLRQGTTAQIRLTSLSGVANRYVSLAPGPNNSPEIEPGTTITGEDTTTPVDIDQLFNIFREREREALQKFIRGNAELYAGKGKLANRAYEFLNPSLSTSERLFAELSSDSAALSRFLVAGSDTFSALADRRDDLTSLITTANQTMAAIAARNEDLDRSLAALPETLRQTNTTYVNLRSTLDDLDPLVEASYPATRNAAPFLRKLAKVSNDSVPVFTKLADIARLPGQDNDLADTLKKLPTVEQRAGGALPAAIRAMNVSQDDIAFLRPYTPDILAWFAKFGQVSAYYNGDGHYARVMPAAANPFDYDTATNTLTGAYQSAYPPISTRQFPVSSSPPYVVGPGGNERCPGAGSVAAPDSSNPFVGPAWPNSGLTPADCNPGWMPPGP
ncbi:MAG TPA: MlaD family protein [Solirubrobacterales bacterium]|nr:MlaD family protein [Solirubrobacterales bacterium]